jgi:hypothetical protein
MHLASMFSHKTATRSESTNETGVWWVPRSSVEEEKCSTVASHEAVIALGVSDKMYFISSQASWEISNY